MSWSYVQTKFSRKEIDTLCAKITAAAVALEMLEEEDKIVFIPGSVSNGHAPELSVYNVNSEGHRKHVRYDFLPEFVQKDTRNTVGRVLAGIEKSLTIAADTVNPVRD